jgi:hypothetical protein
MNARRLIHCVSDRVAGRADRGHSMGRLPAELPSGPGRLAHRRAHDLPPWAIFTWARDFGPTSPSTLNEGYAFIGGAFILATLMLVGARRLRRNIPVRRSARIVGPASAT